MHFAAPSTKPCVFIQTVFFPRMKELGLRVPALGPILAEATNAPPPFSHPGPAQQKNLPEDTPLSVHWLFGVWMPALFLLQSTQRLASWHPVQHQDGCSKGQPSPLLSKGNLAIPRFTEPVPCPKPRDGEVPSRNFQASCGEKCNRHSRMFTQHPC